MVSFFRIIVVAVILTTVLVATVCDMGGWFKARPDKHESCVHTITEGNSHIVGLSDRTRKKNLVYFNCLSILYFLTLFLQPKANATVPAF
jgi:hypothetical protein